MPNVVGGNNRGRGAARTPHFNVKKFQDKLAEVKENRPEDGFSFAANVEKPKHIEADTTAPAPPSTISMTPSGDAPQQSNEATTSAPPAPSTLSKPPTTPSPAKQAVPTKVTTPPADEAPESYEAAEETAEQAAEAAANEAAAEAAANEAADTAAEGAASAAQSTVGGDAHSSQAGGRRPRREPREPREPREGHRLRYVPTPRDVSEIRKEDAHAANLYKDLFDNDEDITVTGVDAPLMLDTWDEGRIHGSVMTNIELAGYIKPRKIQSYAIPVIFDGHDVKGQAETGSGKSAAFLVPIISTIAKERAEDKNAAGVKNRPRCIIIEPTRELALQLYDQGRKLADDTNVQVVKAYGEYDYRSNVNEIIKGADIVVGTPGRLYAFLLDGIINPSDITWLVLDEADRLLDDNFKRDILNITNMKNFPKKEDRQTLLFSATFSEGVNDLIGDMLKPKHVSVTNKRQSAPNAKVIQTFMAVDVFDKKESVVNVLKDEFDELKQKDPNAKQQRTLVFVETKRDADVVALYLCQYELPATTINGDRTQALREEALAEFRDGKKPILVATDVCARGLDIKDLDIVINMDMPRDIQTYIHRIGRTGRLVEGRAISFFDAKGVQDKKLVVQLVKMLKETGSAEVPDFLEEAAEAELRDPAAAADNGSDIGLDDLDDMSVG